MTKTKRKTKFSVLHESERTRIAAQIQGIIQSRSNGCLNPSWCFVVGSEIVQALEAVYALVRRE